MLERESPAFLAVLLSHGRQGAGFTSRPVPPCPEDPQGKGGVLTTGRRWKHRETAVSYRIDVERLQLLPGLERPAIADKSPTTQNKNGADPQDSWEIKGSFFTWIRSSCSLVGLCSRDSRPFVICSDCDRSRDSSANER